MRSLAVILGVLLASPAAAQWPDIKMPGLCVFYENGSCRYRGKNGYHSSTHGPCPDNMKGVVPTCRGHPDAWTPDTPDTPQPPVAVVDPFPIAVDPVPVPVEVGAQGQVVTAPLPPQPKPVEAPAVVANDTQRVGAPPSPPVEDSGEKQQGSSSGDKNRWVVLGTSIGAAVFGGVLLVLGVGYTVYRARQRSARRDELRQAANVSRSQRSNLHHNAVASPSTHL